MTKTAFIALICCGILLLGIAACYASPRIKVLDRFTTADGLVSNWIRDISFFNDDVWISSESGLCFLSRGRKIRCLDTATTGLPVFRFDSLAVYHDKLYCGGEDGLVIFDGDAWSYINVIEGIAMKNVYLAANQIQDELWLCSGHIAGGLLKFDGRKWTVLGGEGLGLLNMFTSMVFQKEIAWLGSRGSCIYSHSNGRWLLIGQADGLLDCAVTDLEIFNDDLLVGTLSGIGRWKDKTWRWLTAKEGLASSAVLSLQPIGDSVLVGTNSGLSTVHDDDFKVEAVTLGEGLDKVVVTQIRPDPDDDRILWMGTTNGLIKLGVY